MQVHLRQSQALLLAESSCFAISQRGRRFLTSEVGLKVESQTSQTPSFQTKHDWRPSPCWRCLLCLLQKVGLTVSWRPSPPHREKNRSEDGFLGPNSWSSYTVEHRVPCAGSSLNFLVNFFTSTEDSCQLGHPSALTERRGQNLGESRSTRGWELQRGQKWVDVSNGSMREPKKSVT